MSITLNAGSGGATLATDTITGVDYQIAKLAHGAAGAATLVSTASGLPVQQQGTFTVTQGSPPWTQNVTQLAGTAVDVSSGVKSAGTLRVVIATDQPALTNPLLVAPATGTLTDKSGTITTGGTQQTLAASNAARKYLLIQNNSTGDLWFNFTTAAVQSQPSIRLRPGDSFTFEGTYVSTELVSIIGATTGQTFSAKEG